MLETIEENGFVFAKILYHDFQTPGIHFFTPPTYSQQLGYMHHPKGKLIQPHVHLPVPRTVDYTNEVLLIKSGKVRVDFFDSNDTFFTSRELSQGDVILLIQGGHGFEALEELEMIEIKQGPYAGDHDKRRFDPTPRKEST